MWQTKFDTDWERKKAYLIRSLFHDVPFLSPVPEEDESFDLSRSRIPRSSLYSLKEPSRPPSPLPPLIIEREPNRHDEPDEFYKKLEKKVLSIYRRLFIDGRSDVSSNGCSDTEEIVDMDYITFTSNEKRICPVVHDNESCNDLDQILIENNINERSGLKRTISPEKYEDASASKSKKSKSIDINRSSTENSPKSTTDYDEAVSDSLKSTDDDIDDDNDAETGAPNNEENNTPPTDYSEQVLQVTFKADVHRAATDYEFVRPMSVVYECVENIAEEAVEDLEDIGDDVAILENNEVSDTIIHHDSSDRTVIIEEVELMRTQRVRHSVGSLNNQEHTASSSDEIAMDDEPRQLERHTESPSHEDPVSMEFNINFDLLRRSSVEKDSNNGEEDISRRFRRNSTSSSDRSSICSYADAEVQTSLNHVNSELLKDIFVGTPRVFSLCSCANHSCVR